MDKVYEVIIVEGRADCATLKRYFDAIVVEVGGLGLREDALKKLDILKDYLPLTALLDPDGPGKKIGERLKKRYPALHLISVGKKGLVSKDRKKLGIAYGVKPLLEDALYLGGLSLSRLPSSYTKGEFLFFKPEFYDKRLEGLDKKILVDLANRLERGVLWTSEHD